MPGARIGVIFVRNETNNLQNGALGDDVTQNAWTVNWEHTFGSVQLMAQYGWTDDIKGCNFTPVALTTASTATSLISCDDTKARAYMVGARYLLSKRTWLYATYNQVTNKGNNFADYTAFGITSVQGSPVTAFGADPKIWALGLMHMF